MTPDAALIRGMVCQDPDWALVTRLARAWSVVPFVDCELRRHGDSGHLPYQVYLHIKGLLREAALRDLPRRERLADALRQLAGARIPAVLANETAWATQLYPAPELHPLADIELVVGLADLPRAQAQLLAGAAGASAPVRAVPVELSCTPFRRIAQRIAIPIGDLWERVRPGKVDDVPAWRFSREDMLMQLAVQLVHTGRCVGQLRTLRHIGQVCRDNDGHIEWERLAERARGYGLAKPLFHALRLARDWVGADIPDTALRRVRARCFQWPFEQAFVAAAAGAALASAGALPAACWGRHDLAMRVLQSRSAAGAAGAVVHKLLPAGGRRSVPAQVQPTPRWSRWRSIVPGRHLPSLAIVLPIYREIPDEECLSAIDRSFDRLRHGDFYLIAPQSLDTSFYTTRYGAPIVRFPDHDLSSASMYSRLLLTDRFYAAFARYEFMLVTQDDVFVIRDDLPRWLKAPYDYVGAPWIGAYWMPMDFSPRPGLRDFTHVTYVGNGGFSLRRIAACRRLFAEFESERETFHRDGVAEDMFFSHFGPLSQHFRVPHLRVASDFAWESDLPHMHALCNGQLPMAIHGYLKFNREFFLQTILPAALESERVSIDGGSRRAR